LLHADAAWAGSTSKGTTTPPTTSPPPPSSGGMTTPANMLTRSGWTGFINQTFQMAGAAGTASVVLTAVNDLQPVHKTNDPDRFALEFRAPGSLTFPQAVYTFTAPKTQAITLLTVPVNQVTSTRTYEVVINRAD